MTRRTIPLVLLAAAAAPAQPPTLPVAFELSPRDGSAADGHVQLTLETRGAGRSMMSDDVALSSLSGLDAAALAGAKPAAVRFAMRRAAGMLGCTGVGARRRATGTCGFTADPAFAAALARRGIARPTLRQSFLLATQDVSLALVDELARHGYATPTIEQLVAMAIHHVDAGYVRGLAQAGYRGGSPEALVAMRIQGVSPAWIRGLAAADPALVRLPVHDLVALRIQGVSPGWVRALAALGYRGLTPAQLVAMRIQGVTPEFARRAQAGGRRPSPEALVRMRITGSAE